MKKEWNNNNNGNNWRAIFRNKRTTWPQKRLKISLSLNPLNKCAVGSSIPWNCDGQIQRRGCTREVHCGLSHVWILQQPPRYLEIESYACMLYIALFTRNSKVKRSKINRDFAWLLEHFLRSGRAEAFAVADEDNEEVVNVFSTPALTFPSLQEKNAIRINTWEQGGAGANDFVWPRTPTRR